MNTANFPMPGALRWRAMHHLIDGDGSCSLIYDVERAAVLEVPSELRLHIAPALETGDLDDDLLTWLVDEDLLTTEGWTGEPREDAGLAAWGGGVLRCDDEVHARLAPAADEDIERALDSVFRQSSGTARVQLLLDWGGELPGWQVIERILAEAGRRAAEERQEVAFELVLGARQVTREAAALVSGLPLHVRLRCGDFPARESGPQSLRAWEASSAPLVLMVDMAERTTVQCSLAGGARLVDLWVWAQRAGVRHLDALRSEFFGDDDALPFTSRVREYGNDLRAVCDEIGAELEAGRIPLDYRPLTRMVRRLMGSEGRPQPLGGDDLDASPCGACWARHLCNHSSLLATPWSGDEREPSPERCAVWLAEAEAALRLYHRLAQCDPMDVLRLLGDSSRMPLDPLGRRETPETPRLPF
jgi:hypothetical protein